MSRSQLSVGDRVRENWSSIVGTIEAIHDGERCTVRWPARSKESRLPWLVPAGETPS